MKIDINKTKNNHVKKKKSLYRESNRQAKQCLTTVFYIDLTGYSSKGPAYKI